MRRPASVGDAGVRVEDLGGVRLRVLDELLELGHLPDLFEGEDLILLVPIDGQTGGIITTILEPGKSCRNARQSDSPQRGLSRCWQEIWPYR